MILRQDDFLEKSGDLEEVYSCLAEELGLFRAKVWFLYQVLKAVPVFFVNEIYWRLIMFMNHLKMAFRHIEKYKGYAFINVFGLFVSIACCILMFLWVSDELSYDRFYKNADRICRIGYYAVISGNTVHGVQACPPLAPTLASDFPEVVAAARFRKVGFPVIRYDDKVFSEERWFAADSTFFNVFAIPFIAGDPRTALVQPNSVVITRSTAEKYFGSQDPMGKTLNSDGRRDWNVTGVVEDVPDNSHFHFDFLASMVSYGDMGQEPTWISNNYYTYFVLQEGVSWKVFEEKLQREEIRYVEPQVSEVFGATWEQMIQSGAQYYHFLQPLTWIHLHSHLEHELEPNGDIVYVYIFTIAALGVLVLAVVNFVNLSTARSANRAKEVGIRKTVGSTRSILIRQFLTESMLYVVASTILAVLTVELVLPAFNHFVGKELHVPYFESPFTIPAILGFILLLGILAGLYPAFLLSAFRPVSVLKDDKVRITKHPWTRSVLVVFQFSVAIVLIISTFVVRQQVNYIQEQKLEFDKERILIIHKTDDLGREIRPFKQELLKNPHVLSVANSDVLVGGKIGDDFYKVPGKGEDAKRVIHHIFTDADYGQVYALKMTGGSFFPDEFPPDRRGLVLNESAVRILGLEDPVGKVLERNERTYPIVGVMRDFHYRSLHHTIAPLIIQVVGREAWGGREISVRVSLDGIQDTIAFLERTWRQFTGNQAFEYEFFDDYYDSMYRAEMRTGGVFTGFTLFAVFIASLGLFGLSSFIVEQRTKEIGIRKVLGATVFGIVVMLTKQFIKWVLVSTLIAWPLAFLIMDRWLQNFQYRKDIALWIFVVSSGMATVFALMTVGIRSISAARTNPVESLRYE